MAQQHAIQLIQNKMKNLQPILITVFLFIAPLIFAQNANDSVLKILEGYWEGAIIKDNSYQKLELEFKKPDTDFYLVKNNSEINPIWGRGEYDINIDSLGNVLLYTMHGEATLTLDKNNLELIGMVKNSNPSINLHLKKAPSPPKNYTIEEVKINNEGIELTGHLHLPKNRKIKSAVIYVRGRGCVDVPSLNNLYGIFLRDYGIAVLSYYKRGLQSSGGDCETATLDELSSDLIALKKYLDNHPAQFEKIGVIGSSAGAWVMTKAEEKVDFDFMISLVGPSTSVYEQQMHSLEYGLDEYNLTKEDRNNLIEYTNLLFEAKPTKSNFEKFTNLLKNGKSNGWVEILDDSDIPSSVPGIDSVWVRRHNFDPKNVLSNFNKPFLAIFGEKDWVVPYKENIKRLEEVFADNKKKLLTTSIAYNSGHGLYTKSGYVNMENKYSYWHFVRASPKIKLEIISFLRKHGFIEI